MVSMYHFGYKKKMTNCGDMNELDRCAYYYIRMSEASRDVPNCKTITYNSLVNDPYDTILNLSEELNMTWGKKTEEIISTVKRNKIDRDMNIINKLSRKYLQKMERFLE